MLSQVLLSVLAASSAVSAHGVLIKVVGLAGSPEGVGFQVDNALARNCTGISPCQQDTTIIRNAEIAANIVNECGRTELTGNIDVGENTENQLAAGQVTQVKAGSTVAVTIHQVNADGAGPYECDIDMTSNSGVISQNLTVTNNVPGVNGLSQVSTTDFTINVAMPDNLACTGASTGNICTVRCRNNAVAGPFGGCFPVQQTDIAAAKNSADQLQTTQTADGISQQVKDNNKDLPAAIDANQKQGTPEAKAEKAAVDELLGNTIVSKASPTQTLAVENVNGAGAAKATGAAKAGKKNGAGANANADAGADAAAAPATATATVAPKAGKNNKNNNNNQNNADKRSLSNGMRWAKRNIE